MSGESQWIRACSVEDAPTDGLGRRVKIGHLDLALFHWDQGYYALENFCPHQGFPLTEGVVQDGAVICGWHGWRIGLEDGGCWGRSAVVAAYRCEVRGDAVYIEIPQ